MQIGRGRRRIGDHMGVQVFALMDVIYITSAVPSAVCRFLP